MVVSGSDYIKHVCSHLPPLPECFQWHLAVWKYYVPQMLPILDIAFMVARNLFILSHADTKSDAGEMVIN